MQIGGFLPLSLCDFPGKIAAVLFTQGCNYRCPFCHNGGLIHPSPSITLPAKTVWQQLARRREFLEGVVVSGGEPTLQKDLGEFFFQLRDMGFATKLDTNGSDPARLRELLGAHLLDYVAMDVKAPLDRYSALAGIPVDTAAIEESMRLLAESGIPHRFRTTWVPALHLAKDREKIKALIPIGSPHLFQNFQPQMAWQKSLRSHENLF